MLYAIHNLAQFLNQYANLLLVLANILLVFVTAAYVLLTWRTLKALQQTSLREREARHLEDIKSTVIQPIVLSIGQTVLERFTGREPPLVTIAAVNEGDPRRLIHLVDNPFTARRHLGTLGEDPNAPDEIVSWGSTELGRVSMFLFDHARRHHFPQRLEAFDRLIRNVSELTGAILEFANESSNQLARSKIPPAATKNAEKSMAEWSNPHLMAAECVLAFLQGAKQPRLYVQDFGRNDAIYKTLTNTHGLHAAMARDSDTLERWRNGCVETMRERWSASDLPKRIAGLLKQAAIVRDHCCPN